MLKDKMIAILTKYSVLSAEDDEYDFERECLDEEIADALKEASIAELQELLGLLHGEKKETDRTPSLRKTV